MPFSYTVLNSGCKLALFATEVGVTITMAACGKNVSACSQERCPLGRQKYFSENFESEIALYRGGRKDYNTVLAKRYVVCVLLNGESGFQDDVVMRKLKFGELLLAR